LSSQKMIAPRHYKKWSPFPKNWLSQSDRTSHPKQRSPFPKNWLSQNNRTIPKWSHFQKPKWSRFKHESTR